MWGSLPLTPNPSPQRGEGRKKRRASVDSSRNITSASTYPSSACRNAPGSRPTTANPCRSHARTAAAFVATTKLNCIARKPSRRAVSSECPHSTDASPRPRGVGRHHVPAVGDVRAAARLVRPHVVGADHACRRPRPRTRPPAAPPTACGPPPPACRRRRRTRPRPPSPRGTSPRWPASRPPSPRGSSACLPSPGRALLVGGTLLSRPQARPGVAPLPRPL